MNQSDERESKENDTKKSLLEVWIEKKDEPDDEFLEKIENATWEKLGEKWDHRMFFDYILANKTRLCHCLSENQILFGAFFGRITGKDFLRSILSTKLRDWNGRSF